LTRALEAASRSGSSWWAANVAQIRSQRPPSGTADKHPIANLLGTIERLLPHTRLPFQHVAGLRRYG
jgi:hypothetical protein